MTKTLVEHAPPGVAIEFVEQAEQRGTGRRHGGGADRPARRRVDDDGDVVVLPGDTPLLRPATLAALVRHHRAADAAATLLTAGLDRSHRVRRVSCAGGTMLVARVVEHADAARRGAGGRRGQHVHLLLPPQPCWPRRSGASARPTPRASTTSPTWCGVLHEAGYRVVSVVVDDPMEAAGVNDRAQLAVAEAELRDRINERWMRRGVTMWDPERTYVDADVELAARRGAAARGDPPG